MYGDGKVAEHPKEAGAMAMARAQERQGMAGPGRGGAEDPARSSAGRRARSWPRSATASAAPRRSSWPTPAASRRRRQLPRRLAGADRGRGQEDQGEDLICHGAADGFIKEETIQQVRAAYEKAGVDYEMIYYGGAVHGFTVPEADQDDARHALQSRRGPPFVGRHAADVRRGVRGQPKVITTRFFAFGLA